MSVFLGYVRVTAPHEGHFHVGRCSFRSAMYRAMRQLSQVNVIILSGSFNPEMMMGASDRVAIRVLMTRPFVVSWGSCRLG